jgi:hypothetical protein
MRLGAFAFFTRLQAAIEHLLFAHIQQARSKSKNRAF